MHLTLVRHTSLQIASGICYGESDVDVSTHFAQEVSLLKTKLSAYTFDAVYTSPLQRCVKLASALGQKNIQQDACLKELNFGDWEMQAWDSLQDEYFNSWSQNYAQMAPPNGETFAELQQRGVRFLKFLMEIHPQQHILAVTHGGMIRALIAYVLNMPLKGLFRFEVDYASMTQLDFSADIPKVVFVNR